MQKRYEIRFYAVGFYQVEEKMVHVKTYSFHADGRYEIDQNVQAYRERFAAENPGMAFWSDYSEGAKP